MIVECRIDDLLKMIGKKLTLKKLEDILFLIKAEVEKVDGNIIEIEVNPDRQDMLSTEGIARAVRSFLKLETGLWKYPVKKSGKEIIVKPGLSKIRPYICCSIVKGIPADDDLIKEYMHLQDALTSTHGRNRSKASIGLYVYDEIKFPVIYGLQSPEKIKFVPLGHEIEMDGLSIMKVHEKGVEFGHIINEHKKWPLLYDSKGQILSLPPIINSNTLGRMTVDTRNLFIEVTGTHLLTVQQALNIITASLAERGGTVESVAVIYPDETKDITPDFNPNKMNLKIDDIKNLIGLDLTNEEIIEALQRMGYGATITKSNTVNVLIPKVRMDILHPVDIIEDIAIGYGFDNIEPSIPMTMTMGRLSPATRLKNKARDLMVGLGYQEIMNYIMSSPDVLNTQMERDEPLITTGNPKSRKYSVLRNSLLPVLLEFTSMNQHADYPQKVFEVGDIVVPNNEKETCVDQIPSVCGITTDVKVNITNLLSELGFLMRNLGLDNRFEFESVSKSDFIDGRSARIKIDGKVRGYFGEISPKILTNFGIGYPIVAFELHLPRDMKW